MWLRALQAEARIVQSCRVYNGGGFFQTIRLDSPVHPHHAHSAGAGGYSQPPCGRVGDL